MVLTDSYKVIFQFRMLRSSNVVPNGRFRKFSAGRYGFLPLSVFCRDLIFHDGAYMVNLAHTTEKNAPIAFRIGFYYN